MSIVFPRSMSLCPWRTWKDSIRETEHLLDHARFDLVICAGAAGALSPKVKVGDLIIATSTLEHNYNIKFSPRPKPRFAGHKKNIEQIKSLDLSAANFTVHFGIMAGGDEDVIEVTRGAELYKAHNALADAWEGVGVRVLLPLTAYLISKSVAQLTQPTTKRLLCFILT